MRFDTRDLRFLLPLACGACVALIVACNNGGGKDDVDLPALAIDCDLDLDDEPNNGAATDCGTGSSFDNPAITARIKDEDADCDGSAAGTIALGTAAADECYSAPQNDCTGTVTAWTTPDGSEPITELEEGDYLLDVWLDTFFSNNGILDVGEPHSCTEFELEEDLDLVTADFWVDFS